MKNEKKPEGLFHKGAYLDAVGRCALPMLFCIALLAILEIYYCFYLNREVGRQVGDIPLETFLAGYFHYTFQRTAMFLTLVFLVVTPLLVLYLFQFQNKRAGSDLFHAFPVRRRSMVFSYSLAILSIDAVILLSVGILVEVLGAALPYLRFGDENTFFLTLANCFAGCVFTLALMLLVLSLSGTTFAACSKYVVLLFVPRLVLKVWEVFVFNECKSIPDGLQGTILDDRLNVVENLYIGYWMRDSYDAIKSLPAFFFTLLVSIPCFLAAVRFFEKRPAECAGTASVSGRVQSVFRILLGCGVSLAPLSMILEANAADLGYPKLNLQYVVTGYLVTAAMYLLFEIMTGHNVKKLLRSLPELLYVVLFNVLFLCLAWYGTDAIKRSVPDAAQVRSVRLSFWPEAYYAYPEDTDYYCTETYAHEITDPQIIDLLCDGVRKTNEDVLRGAIRYEESSGESLRVYFDGGTFFPERFVDLNGTDFRRLMERLAEDPVYRDIYLKPVPKEEIAHISVVNYTSHIVVSEGAEILEQTDVLTEERLADIQDMMQREDMDSLYALYTDIYEKLQDEDFNHVQQEAVYLVSAIPEIVVESKDGRRQRVQQGAVYLASARPEIIVELKDGRKQRVRFHPEYLW
ncbi:MAG: hypothetical protein IJ600_04190 [Lachnospiraceae bacterium]|nr:hypothetical protein [Lachnospiraceae bacterium]